MNQQRAVEIAIEYLYLNLCCLAPEIKYPIENYKLNGKLNYDLCISFARLEKVCGEDNLDKKDIYLLVESLLVGLYLQDEHAKYPLVLKV